MRILVISDSHGRCGRIEQIIEAQPTAKHIFFLGDCVRDIEDYPYIYADRTFHIVSGNCDYASTYKSADTVVLEGKKIFITHGHHLSVKSGIARLKAYAEIENADLVLFGHTHIATKEYANGVHFVNPGSISSAREGSCSYAVIDIEKNGIMPIHIEI